MTVFIPGGPARFAHQKAGLKRMIETGGTTALLWSPGTGKTAATIDFLSVLALSRAHRPVDPEAETRVLVVCPLAAVDTWASQMETWASPQVGFWAEALGGTIIQRAEALASRGGRPYSPRTARQTAAKAPRPRSSVSWGRRPTPATTAPQRDAHVSRSRIITGRSPLPTPDATAAPIDTRQGPDAVEGPRLVIEVLNLDTFSSRVQVGSRTSADVLLDAVTRFAPEVVIVDECHPAGTQVSTPSGPRSIEDLEVGDTVLSFDGRVAIETRVTHTFSRETSEGIWKLGEVQATPEHPVFTTRGFIAIKDLQDDDQVVRVLPRTISSTSQASEDPEVLFSIVLEKVHVPRESCAASTERGQYAGSDRQARCEGKVAGSPGGGRQPVQEPERVFSWYCDESGAWVPYVEWGERDGVDEGAASTFSEVELAYRSGSGYRRTGTRIWLPLELQSGHSESGDTDSDRGGWGDSSNSQGSGTRLSKDGVPREDRLDGVSLHQPTGDRAPGRRRRVYNIETEVGTYFAGGYLVHNSHRIKGSSSNVSRLLARIGRRVPRRIILTGTVMPHSPMDVYGQWRFLDPEAFSLPQQDGTRKPMSYGAFESRYAKLGGWMGRQAIGFQRLDEMQAVMSERASVVRKADALDLPKTTDVVIPVNLDATEQKAYDEMKKNLVAQIGTATVIAPNRLTQMLRLRQITSGASKVRTIRSIVHDTLNGESRIVVFAQFRDEIRALETALAVKGTEVMTITGDTTPADRMAYRRRFGSPDPARLVLLCQIRTMSLAVNELVTASHAVFATLPQQRDDLVQARDRLHRIGQTLPVTFWYAIAHNTVDEVVMTSHRHRSNLERAMLRHVRGDQ